MTLLFHKLHNELKECNGRNQIRRRKKRKKAKKITHEKCRHKATVKKIGHRGRDDVSQ